MTAPAWSPVDEPTADLLTLVRDQGHPSADHEWDLFLHALATASLFDGVVSQNRMRPLIRGRVAPKRIGAFYHRAVAEGYIVATGEWETSDDTEGRNGGKPCRIYRRTAKTVGES